MECKFTHNVFILKNVKDTFIHEIQVGHYDNSQYQQIELKQSDKVSKVIFQTAGPGAAQFMIWSIIIKIFML